MAELFAHGYIVEIIVAFMILEFIALSVYRHRTGRGVPNRALIANFCAGAALLMSLRAALTNQRWQAVSLWLLLGLLMHICDLRSRWSRGV